jgi:D-alanine-D-alanine ligase
MLLTRARIGVLMGGQSAERPVSLKTGRAVADALRQRGYDVVTIDVDRSLPHRLRANNVELAFVALHGPGGEDGTIQGMLELMGIPYTGSGVRASAIAMHKGITKALLAYHGLPVPRGTVIRETDRTPARSLPKGLRWPVVVKPAAQGSTIGVTIVRSASGWRRALQRAFRYDSEALVEAYVAGRELTVSVLDGTALPVVEILAPSGFYDYAAKYEKGLTRYLCPAPLAPALGRQLRELAVRTYRLIGCEGAARVDFRVNRRGRPCVLEANTVPGMTETSLLPMAAAQVGLDYGTLAERILASALKRGATMAGVPTGATE